MGWHSPGKFPVLPTEYTHATGPLPPLAVPESGPLAAYPGSRLTDEAPESSDERELGETNDRSQD